MLKASSAWTQGSSNPRKHDAANGASDAMRSPVLSEQVGAATAWMRRITSVPPTAVADASAMKARGGAAVPMASPARPNTTRPTLAAMTALCTRDSRWPECRGVK